jgi:class 3 adenylate cyclase
MSTRNAPSRAHIRPSARVLAADDDPQVLAVLSAILGSAGHTVLLARSGEECMRVARSALPDIILLDVNMPVMDGFATAEALSGGGETRNIPIVMVTGLIDGKDRVRALKAGAVDFLSKPFKPDELVAKVQSLARLKAYHDEMQRQQVGLMADVAGKGDQLKAALDISARFVPREFLRCLSKKSIAELALGDQVLSDMAILFADIRSFTALSERMTPRDNFRFLNSYLGRMNPFIWENGGYIDKYIGDAIMALFPTGAGSALDAAIAMLVYIPVYNSHRAASGYAPISIGVGVNTGPVMLGVIGHERFMQGTVISDAVNLASRLEGLTKIYGASLIVSNYVLFGLEDPNRYHYRFLDRVRLKGKADTVPVYEVFNGDPPELLERKKRTREAFERGVYEYHAGDFKLAAKLFDEIHDPEAPEKAIEIYRTRCRRSLKLGSAEPVVEEPG